MDVEKLRQYVLVPSTNRDMKKINKALVELGEYGSSGFNDLGPVGFDNPDAECTSVLVYTPEGWFFRGPLSSYYDKPLLKVIEGRVIKP